MPTHFPPQCTFYFPPRSVALASRTDTEAGAPTGQRANGPTGQRANGPTGHLGQRRVVIDCQAQRIVIWRAQTYYVWNTMLRIFKTLSQFLCPHPFFPPQCTFYFPPRSVALARRADTEAGAPTCQRANGPTGQRANGPAGHLGHRRVAIYCQAQRIVIWCAQTYYVWSTMLRILKTL